VLDNTRLAPLVTLRRWPRIGRAARSSPSRAHRWCVPTSTGARALVWTMSPS